ncbi:PQQ-dependent sugar dehydrogenase [Borreliella yangtzensis]|uniref:Glucose/arabinose dehydrogenase n=1 Tax=Borreliella yangtzensis TaxID=683292 RepID=A0ABR6PAB0_9SPIR|nr:sorbosone dehydrogenase family protein [Borreliella yangtzensis]MBB6043214.1 glucose/arabinose dehydrogenase [Borreliella yangtzensis]WKC73028.1 sorbosone dehydrogenase family protein [Borreliella yangtzensis]WKC73946.1 sorbosone dehydrogenase family protein [Borreliella yangtzensis]
MKNQFLNSYFQLITAIFLISSTTIAAKDTINTLKVPNGFKVEIFLNNTIEKPRGITSDQDGNIFIGSGSTFAYFVTKNKKIYTIAKTLKKPIGIAYWNNKLYISSVDKIYVVENVKEEINKSIKLNKDYTWKMQIFSLLPKNTSNMHSGRYIKVDPQNNKLIVNIGSQHNAKIPPKKEAILLSIDLKTKNEDIVAFGVRNSVGFDFHPISNEMYFSDNGQDGLGDNIPPDEINLIIKYKEHFGFPYVFGKNKKNYNFYNKAPKNTKFIPSIYELPAHVAPLGIHFYKGNSFPKEYINKLFIAEHGSWNRSAPIGYRITTLDIDPKTRIVKNYKVFLHGFLKSNKSKFGRPVDIITYHDGSILFSDDFGNKIYRVYYEKI